MLNYPTFDFNDILEIEDSLQNANVFLNEISKEPCHSDSCMAIVDFVALEKWIKNNKVDIIKLKYALDYWEKNINTQPPLRIIAYILEEKVKLISELINANVTNTFSNAYKYANFCKNKC